MLTFEKLTLERRETVESAVRFSGSMSCQLTFPALYALDKYGVSAAFEDDFVFIRHGKYDSAERITFLPPLPRNPGADFDAAYAEIEQYCEAAGVRPCFADVTELDLPALRAHFKNAHQREMPETFDYIYLREKLCTLPGGEFKRYRQESQRFLSANNGRYSFEPVTAEILPEILEFQQRWLARYAKEKPAGLESENSFISLTLSEWEGLGLRGAVVRMDGSVQAYTYGCAINDKVFDILIEKANYADYPDLYKVINREFACALEEYRYINRENDLGVEGLRTAKRRYHPEILLKKYFITV